MSHRQTRQSTDPPLPPPHHCGIGCTNCLQIWLSIMITHHSCWYLVREGLVSIFNIVKCPNYCILRNNSVTQFCSKRTFDFSIRLYFNVCIQNFAYSSSYSSFAFYNNNWIWTLYRHFVSLAKYANVLHRKKSFSIFLSPVLMSLTKLSRAGIMMSHINNSSPGRVW